MSSIHIDNTIFRHNMTAEQLQLALADVSAAHCSASKMAVALKGALTKASEDEEHIRSLILFSQPSLLHSVIRANKKLREHHRATLERCLSIPSTLEMTNALTEPVKLHVFKKFNGSERIVLQFGLKHRTRHDVIARVMGHYLKPRAFQFTQRGVAKAAAFAKQLINNGCICAARLDIKDFFASFNFEKLAPELPLPKKVVEHAVAGRHLKVGMDQATWMELHNLYPMLDTVDLLDQAHRGLPLGSGCSSIVAGYIMSKLPWSNKAKVWLLNYVDDFLILAASQKQLQDGIGELTDAVSKLAGGNFELKQLECSSLKDGVTFLSHRFRMLNDVLKTTVLQAKVEGLYARLVDLDVPAGVPWGKNFKKCVKSLAAQYAVVIGWRAAFTECDDVARHSNHCLAVIEQNAKDLGITLLQLKGILVDESMGYNFHEYSATGPYIPQPLESQG